MPDARLLLAGLRALHDRIRDQVVAACEHQQVEALSAVVEEDAVDTIYAVDRVSESILVEGLGEVAASGPLWLMAEGLPSGGLSVPAGLPDAECRWRVLVDPIDGTRGLMYQKRPAWILTGVAPNRGPATRLRDIVLAVQTEIPLLKQHQSDQLWAVRGEAPGACRHDRIRGSSQPLALHRSRADSPLHGFASVVRFFPGARDVLGAIDDEVAMAVLGPPAAGKAACFEDQYLSTGGQLYELVAGHDRFIADLRAALHAVLASRGLPLPLCCHPYDLCTWLIAEAHGVVLTDQVGRPFDGPFDLEADLCWVGYANPALRSRVEPALLAALARRGLVPPGT